MCSSGQGKRHECSVLAPTWLLLHYPATRQPRAELKYDPGFEVTITAHTGSIWVSAPPPRELSYPPDAHQRCNHSQTDAGRIPPSRTQHSGSARELTQSTPSCTDIHVSRPTFSAPPHRAYSTLTTLPCQMQPSALLVGSRSTSSHPHPGEPHRSFGNGTSSSPRTYSKPPDFTTLMRRQESSPHVDSPQPPSGRNPLLRASKTGPPSPQGVTTQGE